jgi:hypothetical protein
MRLVEPHVNDELWVASLSPDYQKVTPPGNAYSQSKKKSRTDPLYHLSHGQCGPDGL